ncbi:MAG: PilN domain-containing protein [Veillonellaceae bacterium]|jgi:type IV pilus assembly protein PilN|nr:PilN domain-containing protein [Veillonellaceae bacterium]
MRIRINLLPPEQRPPRWRYGRLLSLPVLLVLLIIAGIYGYREYRYWELEQQLAATRSRYEALAASEQQMRIAQTRQAAVQAREKILLELSGGRNSWHGAMVHLGGFMPRKVWLTEIGSAQKGVLQLKGNALTYPELMAFLAKLEQDKLFTESTLLKAEHDGKEAFTKFEITAKLGRQ